MLSEARRENMNKLSIENQNINKTFKQKKHHIFTCTVYATGVCFEISVVLNNLLWWKIISFLPHASIPQSLFFFFFFSHSVQCHSTCVTLGMRRYWVQVNLIIAKPFNTDYNNIANFFYYYISVPFFTGQHFDNQVTVRGPSTTYLLSTYTHGTIIWNRFSATAHLSKLEWCTFWDN